MIGNEVQIQLAASRYRLIADALEAPKSERMGCLRAIAAKSHQVDGGEPFTVSVRTLERWVSNYEKSGITGLIRPRRKDWGKSKSVLPQALDRLITLRKEGPMRSTPMLIDILERFGEVSTGSLKRSTLDRHLDRQSASRRMLGTLGTKRHIRLSFDNPLEFVVGDFHHGPYVRTESGEIVRSKLEAFIDHTSRYVPESGYGLNEKLATVRRALRNLCTAHGAPLTLYLDNGSAFQAGRFHFGCEQIGIKLVHSKAYVSEGRGVIERFNRTVKEAFESEVKLRSELPTLEELNSFWRAWLEERYHRVIHSETKEAPLDRWQRLLQTTTLRKPDPVLLDEVFRLHARRTVHAKTSTVEIGAVYFVVDTSLRKRRVDVLYDPHDLSSVLIYYDGRRQHRALQQRPGEHPLPAVIKSPQPMTLDYLSQLKRDFDKRRKAELSELKFGAVPNSESSHLKISCLLEKLRACTGRSLGEVERKQASLVLETLSPLEISIADVALKIAEASLGHGLHASEYLKSLSNHVLQARKGSI